MFSSHLKFKVDKILTKVTAHNIVFFPLSQIPIRGDLVFVRCTLLSGRVR
jgi:hypothetical protein